MSLQMPSIPPSFRQRVAEAPPLAPVPREPAPRLLLDAVADALGHPGRRAIVRLLAQYPALSPGEIAQFFPRVDRRHVSKQLQVLRRAELVSVRRNRRVVLDCADTPEERALKLLGQAAGGGVLSYSLNREPLMLLALWLAQSIEPAGEAGMQPPPTDGIPTPPQRC